VFFGLMKWRKPLPAWEATAPPTGAPARGCSAISCHGCNYVKLNITAFMWSRLLCVAGRLWASGCRFVSGFTQHNYCLGGAIRRLLGNDYTSQFICSGSYPIHKFTSCRRPGGLCTMVTGARLRETWRAGSRLSYQARAGPIWSSIWQHLDFRPARPGIPSILASSDVPSCTSHFRGLPAISRTDFTTATSLWPPHARHGSVSGLPS